MNCVYLDHNATTKIDDAVLSMMVEAYEMPYNPSSIHSLGKKAKIELERAREEILSSLSLGSEYQVMFTGSGTEANNIALKSFPEYDVITSCIEHHSVLNVVNCASVSVSRSGVIDMVSLEESLMKSGRKKFVSIMSANNETGVVQPIEEVVKISKSHNALVHTDAIQILGKKHINWGSVNPDLVSISAHKFGGPQGVGALIYRKEIDVLPIMKGGGQELRRRPGTHNFSGIIGMAKACSLLTDRVEKSKKLEALRNRIDARIKTIAPDSIIFGELSERLPNTTSISMFGVKSETQVIYFDIAGICVSAGSACSSGSVGVPHVHASMGYDMKDAGCAIRVSLGVDTTEEDVECFISTWEKLYKGSRNDK